jgi:pimeloyl-ACP methyl ester carboxylesterase
LELRGLEQVDWVGTSMGGLIGIVLAAREPSPLRRLILNDIGPFVPAEATAGIRAYLALDPVFPDLAALEAHLRLIHAGFGALTDTQWRSLALHSGREGANGWRMHYDPAIREPFLAADGDIDLWEMWRAVRCPTFVLHGAESPLLTSAILSQMQRIQPGLQCVTLPGVGHAPALSTDEQTGIILRWLGG